jgi:hypothetical protein
LRSTTLLRAACTAAILLLSACASNAPQPTPASPAPTTTRAGTDDPPRSILYVGNSFMYYNNSLHGHVRSLASGVPAADRKRAATRGVSVTISGSGLDWHDMASYFRPDGLGRYSFVGDNEIRFNPPGRQFDAVLMMDCSQCPVHPELSILFFQFAKQHSETVRAHGAEPMFLMTWAYQDKPEMTQGLAAAYTEAGRRNGAHVVPAGLAFANSMLRRPDINLYAPDKRHPSVAGTYLAACTVLASIYGVSPVGNSYTAGLPPAVARYLQETAWQTARTYHGR